MWCHSCKLKASWFLFYHWILNFLSAEVPLVQVLESVDRNKMECLGPAQSPGSRRVGSPQWRSGYCSLVTEESLCLREERRMGEEWTASAFTEGFIHQTWSCPCRQMMPSSCLLEITANQQNAKEPWYGREKNKALVTWIQCLLLFWTEFIARVSAVSNIY